MRLLLFIGITTLLAVACQSTAHHEAAILSLLHDQRDAWNSGDVERFMALGYWRSDELVFVSDGNQHQGYDEVLARYRRRYTEGDAEMGDLTFTDLVVTEVGCSEATATGRWDLDFDRNEDVGGHFTLRLRRFPEGWLIVRDETTSD